MSRRHGSISARFARAAASATSATSARTTLTGILTLALTFALALVVAAPTPAAQAKAAKTSAFIGDFHTVTTLASTVPHNGDVNPYGMAAVPRTVGAVHEGATLISNFNDRANLQGTGSTIVEISPSGHRTLFAHITASALPGSCPGGVGLTTALVALRSGFVIVGSLPTSNGAAATARSGCLIVLNSSGQVVETFADQRINGPWDMTAFDQGEHAALFVTTALNGTVAAGGAVTHHGTVLRIGLDGLESNGKAGSKPRMTSETVIGSGFAERTDPAALVIGPTGVGLGSDGTLYVADSLANRIGAIHNALTRDTSAGRGATVTAGGALNDPLGLTLAPNGDLLTVNGNDGFLIETTPGGAQIAKRLVDRTGSPPGAGTLFGLVVVPGRSGVEFVDDGSNTLNLLH